MEELSFALSLIASLTVGAVFMLAGVRKLRSRPAFAATLDEYQFIPPAARVPLSYAVPGIELVLGALLLTYLLAGPAGIVAAALLAVFTVATIVTFGATGLADCGCMGGAHRPVAVPQLIGRNAALACLAVLPLAIAMAGPSTVTVAAGAVALAASLSVLAASLLTETRQARVENVMLEDPARRRVLKAGVAAVAGVATASFIPLLRETHVAEAACWGCETCSKEYHFIACAGNCCAYYWVRWRDWCSPSCYPCGTWWIQTFCGIPGCGCS